jgi:LAGLIDADG DNA endonuclease family protein
MTSTERAWLAGLLDAEGCFYTRRGSDRPGLRPVISVKMADRDLIERAAALVGTKYIQVRPPDTPRGTKTQYAISVFGQRAIDIMEAIYPWLGERRRARIEEILAATGYTLERDEAV